MPAPLISPAACLSELRRVAASLGKDTLTTTEFDHHASMSSRTVNVRFGSWEKAMHAAGLTWRHNQWHETPMKKLAHAFAEATVDLGHIPNLTELSRRTGYARNSLADRFSGYIPFKRAALAHLLSPSTRLVVGPDVRALLERERDVLNRGTTGRTGRGRTLGPLLDFRAFRYAPTCELGVVQLFGAVAQELGFEILHTRAAFPDCLAYRRRDPARPQPKRACYIEFEFDSMDFKRHGHPTRGCDLVICWQHSWQACPLPVLELKSEIQKLTA